MRHRRGFKKNILSCWKKIASLKFGRDTSYVQSLREARQELNALLTQQEIYWKQRSKQHWLKHENMNTRFFHCYATKGRRKNAAMKLQNERGEWTEWSQGMDSIVIEYFKILFSSQGCTTYPILSYVHKKVSDELNQTLTISFRANEIKDAMFSMHPDKSPGPNGMNAGFSKLIGTSSRGRLQMLVFRH